MGTRGLRAVRVRSAHNISINQNTNIMIKVTVRVNTNERKYVTSSTKECRLFGILLYRKVYYYPEEGWNGEYVTK